MDEHIVKRIRPCSLAHGGIQSDVPAEQTLEVRAKVPNDGPRSDNDTAHDPERFHNAKPGQVKRRRR